MEIEAKKTVKLAEYMGARCTCAARVCETKILNNIRGDNETRTLFLQARYD